MEILYLSIIIVLNVTRDVMCAQSFQEIGSCTSGTPLLTVSNDRKLKCAWRCQNNADCLSFRIVNGACHLLSDLSITSNDVLDVHEKCYAKTEIILCEGKMVTLTCSVAKKIQINWAMYGEDQGARHCSKTNTITVRCLAENAMETVQNLCENRSSCEIEASNAVFGDPCQGVYKYLHVKYTCL
ncbi:L-rhamnose-binding lectin ELEL-1-like isoform X3 [Dreissena polymorpha]|uniref:SUEL-type lectin domain-containing protein n=1 Tax=Dreissena polymorpha TaxID=45954 RepID=A0A9D4I9V2_DREPO|nr:L-rhamnose-binding lectin ELEL-1-like isoform X3 [Dreissena polymorpha]KAH3755156.1 hypothetical protein DPMN_189843 [Dreissena polymorpha]